MQAAGTSRLERALALAGATLAGLLLSWKIAPPVSTAVDARASLKALSAKVTYYNEVRLGQVVACAIVLALAWIAAAAWILAARLLRRHPSTERVAGGLMCLAPLCIVATVSRSFLLLVTITVAGATILLTPHVAAGLRTVTPTSERRLVGFVLITELLAAAWALFLVRAPFGDGALLGMAVIALCALVGWRFRQGQRKKVLDAIALSPILVVAPMLGFARTPSPWILAVTALLVVALRRLLYAPKSLPQILPALLAPWAIAAVFMIPLGFRDLPSTNHGEHESFNLAWINSVLHGKLLFADAGLVHGPLRDYFMMALLRPLGFDLEHTRIVFSAVNLIGLALLLPVSWRLAHRNIWLHSLGAYLLLMQTTARTMLRYKLMTSIGWADLNRMALPTLAVFLAIDAAARPARRSRLQSVGSGVLMGLSLLYSHEYALCGIGAVVVALTIDGLLCNEGSVVGRLGQGARRTGAFLVGTVVPPLLFFCFYVAKGRGMVLLRTAYESVAFFAAGVWGSHPFPITDKNVKDSKYLFQEFLEPVRHFDSPIIFALPLAVYVIAGVALIARLMAGRWSRRMSLLLALFLLGVTSFRVIIGTGDIYHLLSGSPPALLLFVALVSDAASFRLHVRAHHVKLGLGAGAAVLATLAALVFGEYSTGMIRKMGELISGEEKPPGLTPYSHPDVPRAGDVFIPAHVQELLTFIRNETKPTDAIFVRVGTFDGAEFYFLADRRNPTRFDTLSEILTQDRRLELLETLKRDPPELVIGSDTSYLGPAVSEYLAAAWDDAPSVGGYAIRRRRR